MIYLSDNTVISKQSVSAGGVFLRISDKKPGEDIAVDGKSPAQAAETLKNIFSGFAPSLQSDILSQDAISDFLKGKYAGPDGLQRLAADVGVADICPSTMAPTGQRTVPVYVHASSSLIFENYDLVSYGSAKAGPTIIEDTVDKTIEFNDASFISIGYNLRSDRYSVQFFGVTDKDGKSIGGDPVYSVSAQGIHLHGSYSGTVKITGLQIMYHVWDITLTGIALDDGKRLYSGRASVISTAYGLGPYHQKIGGDVSDDAAAQCPFDDTDFIFGDPGQATECFIQVENQLLGACSKELLKPIFFTYKKTSCPPGVVPQWNNPYTYNYNPALPEYYKILEYVTTLTYGYDGGVKDLTAEAYKEICCHPPVNASCIPSCRSIKSTFYGVDIDGGKDKYIKEYAGKTIFVPVGTKTGSCGTLTDMFVDPIKQCCAEVDYLAWNPENPQVVVTSVNISVTGGKTPIEWNISGSGFVFSDGSTSFVGGLSVIINGVSACGTATISAVDACSNNASGYLRSVNGKWVEVERWGIFDGSEEQFAECIIGKYKYYEDYCGRAIGTCPGTCNGDSNWFCTHPPYQGEICTAEGRITSEWKC